MMRLIILLCVVGLFTSCSRETEEIVVSDPCNSFVSEVAPRRTPFLRYVDDGSLELEISFTPAKSDEVDRIVSGVRWRSAVLVISETGRKVSALRIQNGRLIVFVESEQEARDLLKDLCFDPADLILPERKKPNQSVQTRPTSRPV